MEGTEHSVDVFSSAATDGGNYTYDYYAAVRTGELQAESGISTAVPQYGESQDSFNARQEGMNNVNKS